MEIIDTDSWDDFEAKIEQLETDHKTRSIRSGLHVSQLLFRGQGNSDWKLNTTLERFHPKPMSLEKYYRFALDARPRIESFTGTRWEIPSRDKYIEMVKEQDRQSFINLPAFEYMAYLRHHGFPSPLLDWTVSPYLAAFFAFNHPPPEAKYVAIYAYCEMLEGGKSAQGGQPTINSHGRCIRTHARHFLQQSCYTFCVVGENGQIFFAPHEDVIAKDDKKQDRFWKYNIPISERITILKKMERMNINSFSLFGSEESLLEAIATTHEIYLNVKK